VLLEVPRLEQIDLHQPGDGLVTRDWETGLHWLDVARTAGLSYEETVTGAGSWAARGWRHATTDELCHLFIANAPEAVEGPCPGALLPPDPDENPTPAHTELRTLTNLLGQFPSRPVPEGLSGPPLYSRHGTRKLDGLFDDGGSGDLVGRASLDSCGTVPCDDFFGSWTVLTDEQGSTVRDPSVGHYLVRECQAGQRPGNPSPKGSRPEAPHSRRPCWVPAASQVPARGIAMDR
jgi:hypothetical protein